MTAPTYINGFGGSVQFGAFTLVVESWTLNMNCEILDTTNTGDGGWESNIIGAKSAEGSCKTYFDTSNTPTGTPGITNGASATITLNVGSSGKAYVVPARVSQCTVENPVKGVVGFNFNFKANGAITYAS